MNRLILSLLLISSFTTFSMTTACRRRAEKTSTSVKTQPPTSVRVQPVELQTTSSIVRYSANIEPQSQIELSFKVGGYIEQILQMRGVDGRPRDVQPGDRIERGTVLARVRASDYEAKVNQAQAQVVEAQAALEPNKAQVAEAQAAFERAKRDFDRATILIENQSITRPEYDAAKAQYEIADARLKAIRAQTAMIEAKVQTAQTLLAEANIPLQDTSLRAPISGIILHRLAETGALITPGKPVFTLADTRTVKAVFGVPDITVEKLRPGSFLTIKIEALSDRTFRGQITSVAPSADPRSRVFQVEVAIPNEPALLKVGQIASIELSETNSPQQVMAVPVSALVRGKANADQYAVFVVEQKGGQLFARRRDVTLGAAVGNAIAVLTGLNIGERVITTGATLVNDGDVVQIIP